MSFQDDVVYLSLLLLSIFWGKVVRSFSDVTARKWSSTLFGLSILFLVSGIHGFHCIFSLAIQILLIAVLPWRWLHVWSFVIQFFYLFFFRLSPYFGILPDYPPHTNAVQMILTLKLIGVAFEIFDSNKTREMLKKDPSNSELLLVAEYKSIRPGILDLFHYSFNHSGLLTGPYYKFRTFYDLHHSSFSAGADVDRFVWARLSRTPVYLALFLLSSYLFPLKAVEDDSYYVDSSFLYRCFYMTPVFFSLRMRLYTGFVLSECSCIMAGLGVYPKRSQPKPGNGPVKLEVLKEISHKKSSAEEYDFESVHNIDEYAAEFVGTMREALRGWNMTVQFWLVNIVYKRFPVKPLRTVAVMIVSSMWHGVHSGYYLSLGSVPFVLMVEDLYAKVMRRNLSDKGQQAYDWFSWFMRMQWFSYLGMGFLLLRIDHTLKFWSSISYLGHLVLPIFYLIGLFVFKPLLRNSAPSEIRPNPAVAPKQE